MTGSEKIWTVLAIFDRTIPPSTQPPAVLPGLLLRSTSRLAKQRDQARPLPKPSSGWGKRANYPIGGVIYHEPLWGCLAVPQVSSMFQSFWCFPSSVGDPEWPRSACLRLISHQSVFNLTFAPWNKRTKLWVLLNCAQSTLRTFNSLWHPMLSNAHAMLCQAKPPPPPLLANGRCLQEGSAFLCPTKRNVPTTHNAKSKPLQRCSIPLR